MNIHLTDTAPEIINSVLLTIDMQKDFVEPDGASPVSGTVACLPGITEVLNAYRRLQLPIVHVVRLYAPDGSNADLCRRSLLRGGKRIVAPGSVGAELVDGLRSDLHTSLNSGSLLAGQMQSVGDREWLMYKPRWDAFYGTSLESALRQLSMESVVIVGCNFPNCPRATAYGASMRDFRVALLRDAISGIYQQGLDELNRIGIETPTVAEWTNRAEAMS